VKLDDRDVHHLRPRTLASRIAYVPQRSIVSAAFTVRQVVELGRYALPPDAKGVDRAIGRLDLREIEHRPYRDLSVGQQQRVTLARALAQLTGNESQSVLVLDEPTAAMDLQHAAQALRLLRELAERGCTVVLAMHDLAMAALAADYVWLLQSGRLVAAGVPCEVLEAERLRQVFGVGFNWLTDRDGCPRLMPDSPFPSPNASVA
jgi:iron complex transport system ATP-binding protein